jgi:5'-3' exonuclease
MLLIDGDIFCYRAACACETDAQVSLENATAQVKRAFNSILTDVLMRYPEHDYILYLTGGGNFRHDVAVTAPYKGNRKGAKPLLLPAIREYAIGYWEAVMIEGEEADDAIATAASSAHLNDDPIMVSIDKDFDQVAGMHYNFVKKEEYFVSSEIGLKSFYKQILTGDSIDNIIGVDGIGAGGAHELIGNCRKETDMWDICEDQLGYDRALENARLLWLRRTAGQMWMPPRERPTGVRFYGEATSTTH